MSVTNLPQALPMIKINTHELTGVLLDWAVAVALKLPVEIDYIRSTQIRVINWGFDEGSRPYTGIFNPSSAYWCGAYIADKYYLTSGRYNPDLDGSDSPDPGCEWWAKSFDDTVESFGATRLEAEMRNIVLSEVGEMVDIPVKLIEPH